MRKALWFLVEQAIDNVLLVLFLCGFALLYAGISSLSRPMANIVSGVLVMGVAAYPYLRPRKS